MTKRLIACALTLTLAGCEMAPPLTNDEAVARAALVEELDDATSRADTLELQVEQEEGRYQAAIRRGDVSELEGHRLQLAQLVGLHGQAVRDTDAAVASVSKLEKGAWSRLLGPLTPLLASVPGGAATLPFLPWLMGLMFSRTTRTRSKNALVGLLRGNGGDLLRGVAAALGWAHTTVESAKAAETAIAEKRAFELEGKAAVERVKANGAS